MLVSLIVCEWQLRRLTRCLLSHTIASSVEWRKELMKAVKRGLVALPNLFCLINIHKLSLPSSCPWAGSINREPLAADRGQSIKKKERGKKLKGSYLVHTWDFSSSSWRHGHCWLKHHAEMIPNTDRAVLNSCLGNKGKGGEEKSTNKNNPQLSGKTRLDLSPLQSGIHLLKALELNPCCFQSSCYTFYVDIYLYFSPDCSRSRQRKEQPF